MDDPAWAAIETLARGGRAIETLARGGRATADPECNFECDFERGKWLTPDELHRLATGGSAALTEIAARLAAGHRFPWKRLAAPPGGFEAAVHAMLARLSLRAGEPLTLTAFPRGAPEPGFRGAARAMFPVGFDAAPPGCGALVHPPTDYEAMDVLVDWFQEPARLAARRRAGGTARPVGGPQVRRARARGRRPCVRCAQRPRVPDADARLA